MATKRETDTPPCDCCGSLQRQYRFSENGYDLVRCQKCGLHYVTQIPTLQSNSCCLVNEKMNSTTAITHRNGELRRKNKMCCFVEMALKSAPSGKWLDIGCGTGTLISIAQELNIDISGIELKPDRRELSSKLTGAMIYDKPIEFLDFAENSFSVVLMIDVFSHLTSPFKTFSCINRVLKPGGIFLLHTSEIGAGVTKHHNYSWYLGDHYYYLGDHTIERYAYKIGFEVIYREKKWVPDLLYSRASLLTKGRSTLRNIIKKSCVYTPGVLPILRWYMLKIRNKNNPHYVSTLLLTKIAAK